MNATELFLKDGKETGIFCCGQCRVVHQTQERADQCCQNYKCRRCQCDTGSRHTLICDPCLRLEWLEEEAARFGKSEKLTTWEGWIYCDSLKHNTGFFQNIAELMDHCATMEIPVPAYAWKCKEIHFVQTEISDLTGGMEGEAPEDFDFNDLNGLDEVEAALKKFNEVNEGQISFQPDYKTSVLLPQPAGTTPDT